MGSKHGSYKRIHTYKHESDVEKGKINKETTRVKKYRKEQKNLLRDISLSPDSLDDETLDAYEDALHSEKKESSNAKVHKERLNYLNENDEID